MGFGLDRMRRMMTVLGSPERSLRAIHVVGTNGESSTTRMIAAILERHGLRTGAFLSPHLVGYRERVRVLERDGSMPTGSPRRSLHAAAGGRARQPHAGGGRSRRAVRLLHGGRGLGVRRSAASRWRSSRPGSAGATTPPACSTRSVAVLTNVGLEHTPARADRPGDRRGEARGLARRAVLALGDDSTKRRRRPRPGARERGARSCAPPRRSRRRCARRGPSRGATSPSRGRRRGLPRARRPRVNEERGGEAAAATEVPGACR